MGYKRPPDPEVVVLGSWMKSLALGLTLASPMLHASAAETVDVAKALKGLPSSEQVFLLYEGTELMGQASLTTTEGKGGLRTVVLSVKRVLRPNSTALSEWTRTAVVDRKGRLVRIEREHEGEGAAIARERIVFDDGVASLEAVLHGDAPKGVRSAIESRGGSVDGDKATMTVDVDDDVVSADAVMAMVLAVERPVEANWDGTAYDPLDRETESLTVHWTAPAQGEMEGMSGTAQRIDIGSDGRHVVYWNGAPYQVYLPGGILLMPASKTDLQPAWDNVIKPRQEAAAAAEAFLAKKLAERVDGDADTLRSAVAAMIGTGSFKLEPTRVVLQLPETSDDPRAAKALDIGGAIVDIRHGADGWSVKAWRPPEGANVPKPEPEPEAEPAAE